MKVEEREPSHKINRKDGRDQEEVRPFAVRSPGPNQEREDNRMGGGAFIGQEREAENYTAQAAPRDARTNRGMDKTQNGEELEERAQQYRAA
jgi:hypothetical protein